MLNFMAHSRNLYCTGGWFPRNFAGRSLRQTITLILLIIFSSFSSYSIAALQKKQDISGIVQRSDLIVRGKVISTESQWEEDSRGRHIYTTVTVKILDKIKGKIKDDVFAFEVVGGAVDDIREVVSGTPAFEVDEDAIVFLGAHPRTSRQVTNGKVLIYDGRVFWNDSEIAADSFIQSLKILEQDPGATIPLGEKYHAPTAKAANVPIITDISFDEALAVANKQVTITGTNFGSTQGYSKVKFFNKSKQQKMPASIISWSNTQIICTVPANISAGSSPVTVTTSQGASSSYVFVAAECFIYNGYKWPGSSPVVSYRVNENTSDCYGEGAAVQRGANTWNNVGANFTFQYGGSSSCSSSGFDGTNCIYWDGYYLSSGTVAQNSLWHYEGSYEILDCDIEFNDWDYDWSTKSMPYSYEYDVESVALHEFGHWLNLGDLEDYADRYEVMYYQLGSGELKRELRPCDRDGICYIYGGCTTPLTVTSPNGGESWQQGTSHDITWIPGDNSSSSVMIDLYKGGSKVRTISLMGTPDDGLYNWHILSTQAVGSDYKVKITSFSPSDVDYSDYNFSITPRPIITVTSPNGGESWLQGTGHYITWTSSGSPGSYVKIELYKGGNRIEPPITSSTYNDGSHYWVIPSDQAVGSDYKVKITSTSNPSCYDYSDSDFSITAPCVITVTSPVSGSWWELGDDLPIRWDSENTSENIKIDLYKDGSLERVIEETWPVTGSDSYDWPIPTDGILTGDDDYQIKVTDTSNSSCSDSSSNFGIATPPEAQDDTLTTSVDIPVTITLQATDEGQPAPPAALTYTIMSLPIYGDLYDPGSGEMIDSVPYTLVGYGNEVEYIPDSGYEGQDSFTFIANDNGDSPGGGDSNEATVSINVTACIFFDDFPSTTLDTANWTETSGTPTVDGLAVNEPSPPYSLHLEATDSVTSRAVDLYECWSAQLHYSWKRVSTESADDLYVDYWDANEWQSLQVLPAGADSGWEPNSVELPDDALHSEFRLRFWADCDSSSDEWYIDDVCVQSRHCAEPPVLHGEPETTQSYCNAIYWDPVDGANEYYAECAEDPNFNNIVANSDWIADTSYEFCGLTNAQEYWYHVKAWVPFFLKTWLQTSQVDFETDMPTDTRVTGDGNVVLAGGAGDEIMGVITNPSFEEDISSGWTATTRVYFSTSWHTDGAQSARLYTMGETQSSGTWFGLSQGVDLTGISTIKFHATTTVSTGGSWANCEARVYIDDTICWSGSGTNQTWTDLEIDTSAYTGTHTLSLRLWFLSTVIFDEDLHYDNIRAYSAQGYVSLGDIVSTAIDLPADGNWGVVDFNTTTPANTSLTVDVLDASDESVILADVASGTDLSEITATSIKLRANLATSDSAVTPALHDWSVTYTDPSGACESDWSDVESSLQCATPGDFEPDCDVDWADFAVLAVQWLQTGTLSADIAPPPDGDGTVNLLDLAVFVENWLAGVE